MGFHFGRPLAENEIVSVVSFSEGCGGNTWVPRERYSLMMSFWVVPDNWLRGIPCSSATAT